MNGQSRQSNVSELIFCISFIFFIILGVLTLHIRSPLFERFIFSQLPDTVSSTEYTERQLVSQGVRGYFFRNRDLDQTLFSERERIHLQDVRNLFNALSVVFLIDWALLAWSAAVISSKRLRRCIVQASRIGLSCIIVGGGAALIFFDRFFTWFHTVSFANDYWLLDPAEHALIRSYPPEFFYRFAVLYFFTVIVLMGIAVAILRRSEK